MDKKIMAYKYNEVLLSHKKGWNTETYNMDEPWKYYAK